MNEDLLTTNQIINSNNKSELIVPINNNTLEYNFFISSDNRNIDIYPYSGKFSIDLPIEITNVSDITLTDINIIKRKHVFSKYNILEWKYKNDDDFIPVEKINTLEKIDDYFNLNKILYGYTKAFETKDSSILFNFKYDNIIHLSLFGEDKAVSYNLFNIINLNNNNNTGNNHKPIRIVFRSINGDLRYIYTLKNIREISVDDPRMKKLYILNVIPTEKYIKPFNNYYEQYFKLCIKYVSIIIKNSFRFKIL